jgi:hypothetical protein
VPRKELTSQRAELLEVLGFDLMAQIEAMLRYTRAYQREVQRLRGKLGKGRASSTDHRETHAAVREHIRRLRKASATFRETLSGIADAAGAR